MVHFVYGPVLHCIGEFSLPFFVALTEIGGGSPMILPGIVGGVIGGILIFVIVFVLNLLIIYRVKHKQPDINSSSKLEH